MRLLIELLGALPRSINGAALHEFADTVARWGADDAFRVIAELMPATLARAIARAARSGSAGEGREAAIWQRAAHPRGPRSLGRGVGDEITELFAEADAVNLDRKQVVLNAFFALEERRSAKPVRSPHRQFQTILALSAGRRPVSKGTGQGSKFLRA